MCALITSTLVLLIALLGACAWDAWLDDEPGIVRGLAVWVIGATTLGLLTLYGIIWFGVLGWFARKRLARKHNASAGGAEGSGGQVVRKAGE